MALKQKQRYSQVLPDDVLEEIFSNFSVKTLAKLMCVSKHWKTLISNPIFKSLHHKNTVKNPPSLLRLDFDRTFPHPGVYALTTFNLAGEVIDQYDLPITGVKPFLLPSQSEFNKVVCLTDRISFFMCNPSTRRCIKLPVPYSLEYPNIDIGAFAYLPSRDEYVIFQLTVYNGFCGILTLSISNEDKLICSNWKIVKADQILNLKIKPWGIFANGFFYWELIMLDRKHLLSFDVEKEKFLTYALPSEIEYGGFVSLVELKGDLYINYRQPWWLSTIELWKLDDDLKWSKKYEISMTGFDVRPDSNLSPIFVNGDGEILFIQNGEYLKYYNPENGSFREVKVQGSPPPWGKMILHTHNTFLLGN